MRPCCFARCHIQVGNQYCCSFPFDKAIDPFGDCLVAFKMNGQDLPRGHGYPVRCIVPGHAGARIDLQPGICPATFPFAMSIVPVPLVMVLQCVHQPTHPPSHNNKQKRVTVARYVRLVCRISICRAGDPFFLWRRPPPSANLSVSFSCFEFVG